jgi:4'-phosphopantetheinyl transferase
MVSQIPWIRPPGSLALPHKEVHVWRANLDLDPIDLESLRATLSPDERARAARFHFPKDQQHFVAARGTLRTILARYLDHDPARLEFWYGPHGKPELAPGGDTDGLRFNLSHSQGLALYAFCRDRAIGVDLEKVRPYPDWEHIASRLFTLREVEALRLVPASSRDEAFLNCWTRKEAFVKARGGGLSLPLDRFEVSVNPGEPACLLSTAGDPEEAACWSIRDLEPAPGYVAAVAVRALKWEFKLWELIWASPSRPLDN